MKMLNKIGFVWEAQRGGPRRRRSNNSSDDSLSEDADERLSAGQDSMARDAAAVVALMATSTSSQQEEHKEQRKPQEKAPPNLTGISPHIRGILSPPMAQRTHPIHSASALDTLMAAHHQQGQLARHIASAGISSFSALDLHAALASERAQQLRQTQANYALGLLGFHQPGWHNVNPGLSAFPGGPTHGMSSLSSASSATRLPTSLEMMAQLQQNSMRFGGADQLGGDIATDNAMRLAAARLGLYGFGGLNSAGVIGAPVADVAESSASVGVAAAARPNVFSEHEASDALLSSLRGRRAMAANESLRALAHASGGQEAQLSGSHGLWRSDTSRHILPPRVAQSERPSKKRSQSEQTNPSATEKKAKKREK
jgi:hypothetical protein